MNKENQGSFLKQLFFPLLFFLSFMGAASQVTLAIANHLELNMLGIRSNFPKVFSDWSVVTILFFSIFLFFLRKTEFKRIFKIGLPLSFLLLTLVTFWLPYWEVSSFLVKALSQVVFLLGWAYVNQVVLLPQAKKYYFALNFFASSFFSALLIFPFSRGLLSFTSLRNCIGYIALLLALAFLCHFWIQKKRPFTSAEVNPLRVSEKWHAVFYLSFIFAGYRVIHSLYGLQFKQQLKSMEASSYIYHMVVYSFTNTLVIFGVSLILIFLGPYLLRKKGWKFLVFLSTALLGILLFSFVFFPQKIYLSTVAIGAQMIGFSMLIPITHIAFLSYASRDRFLIQTWVFLVATPLIEWIGKQISLFGVLPGETGTILSLTKLISFSLLLLILMIYGAFQIAKKRPNLTVS